jgi:hypothetical protein
VRLLRGAGGRISDRTCGGLMGAAAGSLAFLPRAAGG